MLYSPPRRFAPPSPEGGQIGRYQYCGRNVRTDRRESFLSAVERLRRKRENGRSPRRVENRRLSILLGIYTSLGAPGSADTVHGIAVCVITKGMENQRCRDGSPLLTPRFPLAAPDLRSKKDSRCKAVIGRYRTRVALTATFIRHYLLSYL